MTKAAYLERHTYTRYFKPYHIGLSSRKLRFLRCSGTINEDLYSANIDGYSSLFNKCYGVCGVLGVKFTPTVFF